MSGSGGMDMRDVAALGRAMHTGVQKGLLEDRIKDRKETTENFNKIDKDQQQAKDDDLKRAKTTLGLAAAAGNAAKTQAQPSQPIANKLGLDSAAPTGVKGFAGFNPIANNTKSDEELKAQIAWINLAQKK